METKFKIIETNDYILVHSDEEIKDGDISLHPNQTVGVIETALAIAIFKETNEGSYVEDCKKVIAYKPKGNAPALDLPLLPEMDFEDDVEKLAEEYIIDESYLPVYKEECKRAYINGYKAATKVYSEEDLRKAIDMTLREFVKDYQLGKPLFINEYENNAIQSLKQPKTPKWFVAETKSIYNKEAHEIEEGKMELKTTTINGKTYLVGTYE